MTKDFVIIKCPKCGYEYTAAEVFFPKDLLGYPNNIIRDDNGKILLVEGKQPALTETYICDNCETTFKAQLCIEAKTSYNKDMEDEDFVIDLKEEDKEDLF